MRTGIVLSTTLAIAALGATMTCDVTYATEATAAPPPIAGAPIVKPTPKPRASLAMRIEDAGAGAALAGPTRAVRDTASRTAAWTPQPSAEIVRETIIADAATATDAELEGADVVSIHGDSIGEIDAVVTRDGLRQALIGVGGFLGFGETEVMVPVSELELIDAWTFRIRMSAEELERRYATDASRRG